MFIQDQVQWNPVQHIMTIYAHTNGRQRSEAFWVKYVWYWSNDWQETQLVLNQVLAKQLSLILVSFSNQIWNCFWSVVSNQRSRNGFQILIIITLYWLLRDIKIWDLNLLGHRNQWFNFQTLISWENSEQQIWQATQKLVSSCRSTVFGSLRNMDSQLI